MTFNAKDRTPGRATPNAARFAEGVVYMSLSGCLEAIIDEMDYPIFPCIDGTPHPAKARSTPEHRRSKPAWSIKPGTYLHALIVGQYTGEVDHKDGDGLNCRRTNLRAGTHVQNMGNRLKSVGLSSVFKGVSWSKDRSKWVAQISIAGKRTPLGRFESEVEAAEVYNVAAISVFGEFARLNEFDRGRVAVRARLAQEAR